MHFTFDYKTLHFKPAIWKRMIDEKLRAALVEGGTIWINAAISRIPVWSGASHGTFLKLAAKIGYAISIGGGNPMGLGPAYGSAQSTGKLTVYAGAYILEYSTTLWHLLFNELNNANLNPTEGRLFARLRTPGPYHFQVAAAEEFRQYAKTVRLPDPKLATIIQTHKVK
jgi:hypothetical protein